MSRKRHHPGVASAPRAAPSKTPGRDSILSAADIRKPFDELEILKGVTLHVEEGDLVSNAYQDIVNGRLFGVLLDYPIATYYATPNPNLQFSGPPFGQITSL